MSYRDRRWIVVALPLLTVMFLTKTRMIKPSPPSPDKETVGGIARGDGSQDLTPSPQKLCSEFLRRDQTGDFGEPFVVQEEPTLCKSPDSFSSLMTMIASSWIAETASRANIHYDHGCYREVPINEAFIQQLVAPRLELNSSENSNSRLAFLRETCRKCLGHAVGFSPTVDCLGFSSTGNTHTHEKSGERPLITTLLAPLQAIVREAVRRTASASTRHRADVLVYLDTFPEMTSESAAVLPMLYYGEIIPSFVEGISILISPACRLLAQCEEHSQIMGRYFQQMYPRARLHVEYAPSTGVVFARLMSAPLVICPPSTACILPAFLKEPSHEVYLTEVAERTPWLSQLAQHAIARVHVQGDSSMPVYTISADSPTTKLKSFLYQRPVSTGFACQALRGRLGHWEQDMEYAKEAQYSTPLKRFREFPDFTPTSTQPFRTATTYRWIDDWCPVNLMSRDALCQTMQSLGLTRIYIVGDSLNMQMAQALWKLLGHDDDPVIRPSKAEWQESMRFQWSRTVDCPSQKSEFELAYTRNDLVDGTAHAISFDKIGTEFNCGFAEYCLPWINEYVNYAKGGTLLVLNAGSHVHSSENFSKTFDELIGLMDRHQKRNDVVMVRTTVPGHNGCQDSNSRPYSDYHDFSKDVVEDFRSWHLFSEYNDYMEKTIRQRNQKYEHNIHLLDVYPMTVLRKDGHISGPQKCSTCKEDDCLHYILPGPIDWWVHLMYSDLANMGAIRARQRQSVTS